jgi:hypothetical protein
MDWIGRGRTETAELIPFAPGIMVLRVMPGGAEIDVARLSGQTQAYPSWRMHYV